jgi:hypothetical protein
MHFDCANQEGNYSYNDEGGTSTVSKNIKK